MARKTFAEDPTKTEKDPSNSGFNALVEQQNPSNRSDCLSLSKDNFSLMQERRPKYILNVLSDDRTKFENLKKIVHKLGLSSQVILNDFSSAAPLLMTIKKQMLSYSVQEETRIDSDRGDVHC